MKLPSINPAIASPRSFTRSFNDLRLNTIPLIPSNNPNIPDFLNSGNGGVLFTILQTILPTIGILHTTLLITL